MPLSKKKILPSIDSWIPNYRGEIMGKLEGVTLDSTEKFPAYLVLRRDEFLGRINRRYYVISAHPSLVTVTEDTIILRIDEEILSTVMGVNIENIPPFDPEIATIFELYGVDEAISNYNGLKL